MSWKAGDVAIFVNPKHDFISLEPYVGTEVIVTNVMPRPSCEQTVRIPGSNNGTKWVDIWSVMNFNLIKPYDGHDKCSWSECIWEPDLIGVTEQI